MENNISIPNMDNLLKMVLYRNAQHDYLNGAAIFSDETLNFVSNNEPNNNETISIKLRVGKDNIDSAYIHINGTFKESLVFSHSYGVFDFYATEYKINEAVNYYFSIIKNEVTYFYNKRGLYKDIDENYNFKLIPDFHTPNWAKGAVMYQIFVDRFNNGDKTNDVENNEYLYMGKAAKKISDWNKPIENEDIANFYGGDLQGIIDKMAYLKYLGIDAIYLNPTFVSPSSHKYDIQDYDYIDPHFGVIIKDGGEPLKLEKFHNKYATMYIQRTTDKENLEASNMLMAKLIEIAHENNIKVILDGVFNHCGAFNKWLDKGGFYQNSDYPVGAYRSESSPYNKYFKWYNKEDWPNNDCYDSWWNHDNHPKLYFENSQELYDYVIGIGVKWVSPPFNADGWRLDVAADLGYSIDFNHKFWKDFRVAVKQANPNAIILAEHYGDPSDWLKGDQWDTIMNYDAFMEPLTWFLTGMEKHSEGFRKDMLCNAMAFEGAMRYHMARLPLSSLQTSMNQLSNHDHSRFLTRTNMHVGRLHTVGSQLADIDTNKGIMKEAIIFQLTWLGAPTLYYGDEAGLTGWTDPDNRRTYPWGNEDTELIVLYKKAIEMRKTLSPLKFGSTEFLYCEYGFISFGRWLGEESVITVINNNSTSKEVKIPVWKANVKSNCSLTRVIATTVSTFSTDEKEFEVNNGVLLLSLEPFSSAVFKTILNYLV